MKRRKTNKSKNEVLFITTDDLQSHLAKVKPHIAAVGYLGLNWDEYTPQLKELIVAPKVGSHPRAIAKAMKKLGHDNVHLLDDLHAKIYLGKAGALVGSCNLSNNGFRNNREAAVRLNREDLLLQVRAALETYKSLAKAAYPNEAAKRRALELLRERTKNYPPAPEGRPRRTRKPNLLNYDNGHRVHIAWYGKPEDSTDADYNKRAIQRAAPGHSKRLNDWIEDEMWFLPADDVRAGDWLLAWRCRTDDLPTRQATMDWIYVHAVAPRGTTDETYPKLAMQVKGVPTPPEPFTLDADTRACLAACLKDDGFAQFRGAKDPWRVPNQAETHALLAEARHCLRKKTRPTTKRARTAQSR